MNKYACRYAIVQFMPYPETGEFANVGVVLAIPQKNIFAFRLETSKTTRLTHFFNHLERSTFLSAIKGLEEELGYYVKAVRDAQTTAQIAFDRLVRPLETILRFSDERVRMVNTTNPVEDALFGRFVMHDFAKVPDYEGQLQRKIGQMLREIKLEHKFKKRTLGTDAYKVTLPLVQQKETAYRVVQPLFFNQNKPQAIIEHGNRWFSKLDTLKSFGALPRDILIPVKKPLRKSKDFNLAWELVEKKLKNFGDLIQAGDTRSIKAFAKY